MNKYYYVYALIDPRENQYFYIGKGKGKRYTSHLNKSKQKKDGNRLKVKRINDIEKSGYSVKTEILFSNLDENTAFDLEKVIIYRLGREMLDEGILTNLLPGGNRHFEQGLFYERDYKGFFDNSRLSLLNQRKLNTFKKISNVDFFDLEYIYIYNYFGKFIRKDTLKDFFSLVKLKPKEVERYKFIKKNKLPIFYNNKTSLTNAYNIFSKEKFDNIYLSLEIPLVMYDVIDENLHLEFDKKWKKEKQFEISCKIDNVTRMIVSRDKSMVTSKSFYSSGRKKSVKSFKNRKPIGLEIFWFENGNIRYERIYHKRDKTFIETSYYKNGNKKYYDNPKKSITQSWFENGKLSSIRTHKEGYISYNENGEIVEKGY